MYGTVLKLHCKYGFGGQYGTVWDFIGLYIQSWGPQGGRYTNTHLNFKHCITDMSYPMYGNQVVQPWLVIHVQTCDVIYANPQNVTLIPDLLCV